MCPVDIRTTSHITESLYSPHIERAALCAWQCVACGCWTKWSIMNGASSPSLDWASQPSQLRWHPLYSFDYEGIGLLGPSLSHPGLESARPPPISVGYASTAECVVILHCDRTESHFAGPLFTKKGHNVRLRSVDFSNGWARPFFYSIACLTPI